MQNYEKIHYDLTNFCKSHRHEIVTTMFDYYGMPNNTPAISCNEPDIYKRISVIEDAILSDIDQPNLITNLMLHEFEALLFADPQAFDVIADEKAVKELQQIRDEYEPPEYINNSIETAPSKRIIKAIVGYSKVRQGIIVAQKIGIDRMVSECKHFAEWIEKLKAFRS